MSMLCFICDEKKIPASFCQTNDFQYCNRCHRHESFHVPYSFHPKKNYIQNVLQKDEEFEESIKNILPVVQHDEHFRLRRRIHVN